MTLYKTTPIGYHLYTNHYHQLNQNLEHLIIDILLTSIGWLILLMKYRQLDKIKSVVKSEIHGSGEWDPPGGWVDFILDKRNGEKRESH